MDSTSNKTKYDLEERTAVFAEKLIDFMRTVKQDAVNRRIIDQLVGSSGSIGANYCEAVESESKKDFIHKLCIAKKEIKETQHWIRLFMRSNPERIVELQGFYKETHELLLIFAKIIRTSKENN